MYPASFVQGLKQGNISTDGEKTKARFKAAWKAAAAKDKNAILSAAGVIHNTIYRAYNTGRISAKIVVPCAQVFNIDPLYLIGESDEKGECNDETMRALLERLGYGKKLAAHDKAVAKKPRKPRKPKSAENESVSAEGDVDAAVDGAAHKTEEQTAQRFDIDMKAALAECAEEYHTDNEVNPPDFLGLPEVDTDKLAELSEDELIMLLRSLIFRAQVGVPDAVEKAILLKRLLLS